MPYPPCLSPHTLSNKKTGHTHRPQRGQQVWPVVPVHDRSCQPMCRHRPVAPISRLLGASVKRQCWPLRLPFLAAGREPSGVFRLSLQGETGRLAPPVEALAAECRGRTIEAPDDDRLTIIAVGTAVKRKPGLREALQPRPPVAKNQTARAVPLKGGSQSCRCHFFWSPRQDRADSQCGHAITRARSASEGIFSAGAAGRLSHP